MAEVIKAVWLWSLSPHGRFDIDCVEVVKETNVMYTLKNRYAASGHRKIVRKGECYDHKNTALRDALKAARELLRSKKMAMDRAQAAVDFITKELG